MAEKKARKHRWIKGALKHAHGQFREKAEAAGETTREFAKEHAGDGDKTGAQARLAETLMGMNKGRRARSASRYASKEVSRHG